MSTPSAPDPPRIGCSLVAGLAFLLFVIWLVVNKPGLRPVPAPDPRDAEKDKGDRRSRPPNRARAVQRLRDLVAAWEKGEENERDLVEAVEDVRELGPKAPELALLIRALKRVPDSEKVGSPADTIRRVLRAIPDAVPALVRALDEPDPTARGKVVHAIKVYGSPILPQLVEQLCAAPDGAGSLAAGIREALRAFGMEAVPDLAARLGEPEGRVRIIRVLKAIGPEVIPRLVDRLKAAESWTTEVIEGLGEALRAFGPEAIPFLVDGLAVQREASREALSRALRAHGPRALPALVKAALGDGPRAEGARLTLQEFGPDGIQALLPFLKDPKVEVRRRAVHCLRFRYAHNAGPAVPALVERLGDADEEVARAAVEALVSIGLSGSRPLWDPLLPVLEGKTPARARALEVVLRLGTQGSPAQAVLVRDLAAADEKPLNTTLAVLDAIGAPNSAVIPALLPRLKDPKETVRQIVLLALSRRRPQDPAAVKALVEALGDPSVPLSVLAAEALGAIGPSARSAVPALRKVVEGTAEPLRRSAAVALTRVVVDDVSLRPAVVRLLKHEDAWVRRRGAEALGQLGPDAADVAPALKELLGDTDPDVRRVTAVARAHVLPARERRAFLAELLSSPDVRVRRHAIELLRQEESGADLVAPLRRVLADDDARVRWTAVAGLTRLGPTARDALPNLLKATRDVNPRVAEQALYAVARLDPQSVGADGQAALARTLGEGSPAVRTQAAETLGLLGKGSVFVLARALRQDPEPSVRRQAAESLGRIGRPAVPALIQVLEDQANESDERGREAWALAAEALERIGPEARDAVPTLLKRIDHAPNLGWDSADPMLADVDAHRLAHRTARALSRIGRESLHALRDSLKEPRRRAYAAVALAYLGRDGVEVLAAALLDRDSTTRLYAARALALAGPEAADAVGALAEVLRDESWAVRTRAVLALAHLGPAARDALAPLDRLREKSDAGSELRTQVDLALACVRGGKEAVPVLVKALEVPLTREPAISALGRLGPDALPAVPALLAILAGEETAEKTSARRQARAALARLGKNAIPALVEALQTPYLAAPAARVLGESGRDVVPALTRVLEQGSPEAREHAARALGRLGPDAEAALPALWKRWRGPEPAPRDGAAVALFKVLRGRVPASVLLAALATGRLSADEAQLASTILHHLGLLDRDALPDLVRALKQWDYLSREASDPANASVRSYLRGALLRQGKELALLLLQADDYFYLAEVRSEDKTDLPEAQRLLLVLSPIVKDSDGDNRKYAAFKLGSLGPSASPAVPELIAALDDPEGQVRWDVVRALGRIGPAARPAIPHLRRLLTADPEGPGAVVALCRLDPDAVGPDTPNAAAALVRYLLPLQDGYVALEPLTRLARDSDTARNEVVTALGHRDESVRRRAAIVLGQLGERARGAIPTLQKLLRDDSEEVYDAAAEALRQIDPKAAAAAGVLPHSKERP